MRPCIRLPEILNARGTEIERSIRRRSQLIARNEREARISPLNIAGFQHACHFPEAFGRCAVIAKSGRHIRKAASHFLQFQQERPRGMSYKPRQSPDASL